jgi:hypothetical protein
MVDVKLRYLAVGPTPEQREQARDFYSENGDCFLAWINEGDLEQLRFPPPPTEDVVAKLERALIPFVHGGDAAEAARAAIEAVGR